MVGIEIDSQFGLLSTYQAQLHKDVSCSKMKFKFKLKFSDILMKTNETDSCVEASLDVRETVIARSLKNNFH